MLQRSCETADTPSNSRAELWDGTPPHPNLAASFQAFLFTGYLVSFREVRFSTGLKPTSAGLPEYVARRNAKKADDELLGRGRIENFYLPERSPELVESQTIDHMAPI